MKRFQPRTVRMSENQVTHELERTILDKPQLAFERLAAFFDREALAMNSGEMAKFAELVTLLALKKRRHSADDELNLTRAMLLTMAERLLICSRLLSKCAERKGVE